MIFQIGIMDYLMYKSWGVFYTGSIGSRHGEMKVTMPSKKDNR